MSAKKNIVRLAEMCKDIYKGEFSNLDPSQELVGIYNTTTGQRFAIIKDTDHSTVVFMGSQSGQDFIMDGVVSATPIEVYDNNYQFIGIHSGFHTAASISKIDLNNNLTMFDIIKNWVIEERDAKRYVIFTGHSLGGALAIVTAALLYRDGRKIEYVVTYGAPLVGDVAFAEYFKKSKIKCIRVVNKQDPVTKVPTAPYKLDTHIVAKVGSQTAGSSVVPKDALMPSDLEDHRIDDYIKNIKESDL